MNFVLAHVPPRPQPWITPHTLFSLSWGEWASIITILTALVIIARWLIGRIDKELFAPIREQLHEANINLSEFNRRQSRTETRLQRGDEKFIHYDDTLKDHERRIGRLEEHEKR